MTLSSLEAVRLRTSDQPVLQRLEWTANGETQDLKLDYDHLTASPAVRVWRNNVLQTVTLDYTVDYTFGVVSIVPLLAVGTVIIVEYYAVIFTDDEVQHLLDEAGGNTTLAAAYVLLAWAADAAKIARRETLSGGGGIGSATVDTSVRVRELRASAKAYIEQYQEFAGAGVPVEFITEIGWTDQTASRLITRGLIAGES